HPRSTLCPYTTLFRSSPREVPLAAPHRLVRPSLFLRQRETSSRSRWMTQASGPSPHLRTALGSTNSPFRQRRALTNQKSSTTPSDRKSTRLNSSHVST